MSANLIEVADARSFLYKLDARAKFCLLLVSSAIIFVWNNLWLQAGFLAAVIILMLAARASPRVIWQLFKITLVGMIIVLIIQGLWSPLGKTPVFTVPADVPIVGSWNIFYQEGLVLGLVVCCRILAPLLAFQLVFMTTEPHNIVLGLTRLGVPFRVAFLFSTTFRFVPLLLDEYRAMRDAQRLRGIDVDSFPIHRRLPAMGRMLVPLIVASLKRAQRLELALQAKAFTGSRERTFLHPGRERLGVGDWVFIGVTLGGLALALIGRIGFGIGGNIW